MGFHEAGIRKMSIFDGPIRFSRPHRRVFCTFHPSPQTKSVFNGQGMCSNCTYHSFLNCVHTIVRNAQKKNVFNICLDTPLFALCQREWESSHGWQFPESMPIVVRVPFWLGGIINCNVSVFLAGHRSKFPNFVFIVSIVEVLWTDSWAKTEVALLQQ